MNVKHKATKERYRPGIIFFTTSPFFRQCKNVNFVVATRWSNRNGHWTHRSSNETGRRQVVSSDDGDVLPAVHAIADSARGNRSAKDRFPENLSVVRIESSEPAIDVSHENQVSGGR